MSKTKSVCLNDCFWTTQISQKANYSFNFTLKSINLISIKFELIYWFLFQNHDEPFIKSRLSWGLIGKEIHFVDERYMLELDRKRWIYDDE